MSNGLGVCAAMLMIAGAMVGCEGSKAGMTPEQRATIRRDAPPAYAPTAKAFNEKIAHLDRVFATANLKVTYIEDGQEKSETPDGRLQIVRPNKLALSLGKAGQTLFWFGCDPEQYWWFDMSDSAKTYVAIGSHENFDGSAAKRIGLAIRPLDLICLLGIVPLDVNANGATQWSADGKQLGVSTAMGTRGFQRLWLDPATLDVQEVEIFGRDRQPILDAKHEGFETVEITRDLPGVKVSQIRMPSRVYVVHFESKTEVRLTLTGVKDGPVSDKAFDLDALMKKFDVQNVADLDKQRSR